MEEIQTKQETRQVTAVQILRNRQDGGSTIKNGTATDRTELRSFKNIRQHMQEASYKHLSKQLVINSKQSNGAELGGSGDGGDFGQEAYNSTAKGGGEEPLSQHGIEGSEEGRANKGKSGAIEFVREAIQARGLVWGSLLNGGGELRHGEGGFKADTLGRGKAGQAIQKTWEGGGVRGEGSTGIHRVRGVGGGGMAALKDGGVEAQDLSLHPSSVSDVGTRGGRLDRLQTRRAAMAGLSGEVKGPRLLLLDQGCMSAQGNPLSRPRIQAPDLAAAGLNSGPILGGKGGGNPSGEKPAGLAAFGSKEQGKGAAKIPNEGLGGSLPPVRCVGWLSRAGGGNRPPGSGEGG
jgi:hypothetical protein